MRMHLDTHPFLGAIITALLTFAGYVIGGDIHAPSLQVHIADPGLPEWIKDLFQCFAWTGAGVAGFFTGYGGWVKHITPMIQKRRNNKKK